MNASHAVLSVTPLEVVYNTIIIIATALLVKGKTSTHCWPDHKLNDKNYDYTTKCTYIFVCLRCIDEKFERWETFLRE